MDGIALVLSFREKTGFNKTLFFLAFSGGTAHSNGLFRTIFVYVALELLFKQLVVVKSVDSS